MCKQFEETINRLLQTLTPAESTIVWLAVFRTKKKQQPTILD